MTIYIIKLLWWLGILPLMLIVLSSIIWIAECWCAYQKDLLRSVCEIFVKISYIKGEVLHDPDELNINGCHIGRQKKRRIETALKSIATAYQSCDGYI